MANLNMTWRGQHAGVGDRRELFYNVYGNMVLFHYWRNGDFKPFVKRRSMPGSLPRGKGIEFPRLYRLLPKWHTPGTEIIGDKIPIEISRITPDQIMESDVAVSWEDNQLAEFFRGGKDTVPDEFARVMGEGFADADDLQSAITMIRAARGHYDVGVVPPTRWEWYGKSGYGNNYQNDPIDAPPGSPYQTAIGSAVRQSYDPNLKLPHPFTSQDILDVITYAACHIDNLRLPGSSYMHGGRKSGWTIFMRPDIWWRLFQDKLVLNADIGGMGSYARGYMPMFAGFDIVNTAAIPGWDSLGYSYDEIPQIASKTEVLDVTPPVLPGGGTRQGKYWVENPQCTAMIFHHRESICRVDVLDIVHESEWQLNKLSSLGVTYTFWGGGILRGEGCLEVCYSQVPHACVPDVVVDGYNNTDTVTSPTPP